MKDINENFMLFQMAQSRENYLFWLINHLNLNRLLIYAIKEFEDVNNIKQYKIVPLFFIIKSGEKIHEIQKYRK